MTQHYLIRAKNRTTGQVTYAVVRPIGGGLTYSHTHHVRGTRTAHVMNSREEATRFTWEELATLFAAEVRRIENNSTWIAGLCVVPEDEV